MNPLELDLLRECLAELEAGFQGLPSYEPGLDLASLRPVLLEAARRMQDNYPYQHPLYAGQMLKPPHPVARLAYALSLWINPNNHALDGGRASSAMEKEAVAAMAAMFGWREHLGHLCSGGTMANLEALWVAGQLRPGEKILASSQAHYTHQRISAVLGLEFESVPVDSRARLDLDALEQRLKVGQVGTVVATLGTTAVGSVDPLPGLLELQKEYGFRVHVDAAYGGYFTLIDQLRPETRAAFDCLERVDSLVVDPHKHGLQPYGCGCVLFRDPAVGSLYKHDSPYTYFSSGELHLGEISLECSRPGASAVALWTTLQLLPLTKSGQFAADLSGCRRAALALFERLKSEPHSLTAFPPELDIIVWAPKASTAGAVSGLSRRYFQKAAEANLHLALAALPAGLLEPYWKDVEFDQPTVTCLRSCLMKPEHAEWVDRIWDILQELYTDEHRRFAHRSCSFTHDFDLIVERAGPGDAHAILDLQKLAYQSEAALHGDYSIPPLRQTLGEMKADLEKQVVLKASMGGKIVGSVRASLKDSTCFIGRLIVQPELQNRGIGTRLLGEIEAAFGQARRFELFTSDRSERNLYLYQKLGYREFKREKLTEKIVLVFLEKAGCSDNALSE
ncbi:MAG: GNAT family N-acetyltransferase [Thermoflexales bacterium]|nr:GNAT family N-acetyltransferase [Thermoflexales bacterium]